MTLPNDALLVVQQLEKIDDDIKQIPLHRNQTQKEQLIELRRQHDVLFWYLKKLANEHEQAFRDYLKTTPVTAAQRTYFQEAIDWRINPRNTEEDAAIVAQREAQARQLLQSPTEYAVSAEKSALDELLNDYSKQFPRGKIEHGPHGVKLFFNSKAESIAFFTQEAKKGVGFLAHSARDGEYLFSCKNGQIYQGSLADIKQQLALELQQKPKDTQLTQGLTKINAKLAQVPLEPPPNSPPQNGRSHKM